jgi:hypothetical protein
MARHFERAGSDVRRYLEARSMTDRETRLSPAQAITALLLLAAACGATALGFASILGGFLP